MRCNKNCLLVNESLLFLANFVEKATFFVVPQNARIKKSSIKKSFGVYDSVKLAELIIDEICGSRVSKRQIESF